MFHHLKSPAVTLVVITLAATAGCSSDSPGDAASTSSTSTTTSVSSQPLTATQTWIKATTAGTKMTAIFGQLKNTSDRPVIVKKVRTTASPKAEIHEMAMVNSSMVMRPKAGGLTIAPGATATLKPGGDHLMVLNLTKPVTAGDTVTVTLTTDSGQNINFTATAKPFSGANETYHAPATK